MSPARSALALVLAALVLGAGGGRRLKPIDLRDPTVPIEARRWIADAQDEVGMARAELVDAERAVTVARDEQATASRRALASADLPGAASFLERYQQVAQARLDLATATADAARARFRYADARLTLAHAEVAIRYDLGVVDTAPLEAAAATTRAAVAQDQAAEEQQRAKVEQSTDALWAAYADVLNSGGDAAALWGAVFLDEGGR